MPEGTTGHYSINSLPHWHMLLLYTLTALSDPGVVVTLLKLPFY